MTTESLAGRYDEVVTHALARDVALPGGGGTLVLVTLENGHDHTRPTTFGPAGLAELDAVLATALTRDDVAAVAVTGKPYFFAVGADLAGVAALTGRDQARDMARLGHAVLGRLRTAEVPTFAFVNGAVMGGGLELALHCRYRTISAAVPAVALPEAFLGLVPGWGGATLVPRLVGPEAAVALMVENPLADNRMMKGPQAYELGLADAIFEPADFLEQSVRWAAAVLRGDVEVSRPGGTATDERWDAALARGRAVAEARRHGAAPAPLAVLDLVERGRARSVDESVAAEIDALTDLIMSEEFRAGVYAFDLVQRRAKRPAGAPDRSLARTITKVGVVGAGLMAGQLALLMARRLLVPVVITDLDQDRVDRGLAHVRSEIDALAAKGRVSPDLANRLRALVTGGVDRGVFADADLVVEAVFEDLEVKRQVFAELEQVVSETCVLATNTSSLSVTAMAEGLQHPQRVVGLHFFNPVAVLPLLEIVRAAQTDDATLATAFQVGRDLRKSCVLVHDAPAFVVNRLLTRFLGVVTAAVDDGTPVHVADDALLRLGLPMGPFDLLGLVGPAIALHVAETMHAAYPDRFTVSSTLRAIVEAGRPAVYADSRSRTVDPVVEQLLPSGNGSAWTEDDVRTRAVDALADEIRIMLDEGVVGDVRDVDLAMLLGAGWPFHLGGISPYLDRTGTSERVTGRRFLPPGVASVPDDAPAEDVSRVTDEPHPAPPGSGLPEHAFEVVDGELTSTGMTLRLRQGEVRVTFAMPLPVAQIGMFAGRPLPVPPTMFRATLVGLGPDVAVKVSRVEIISASDGTATLELAGTAGLAAAGLAPDDLEVTLRPTVVVR